MIDEQKKYLFVTRLPSVFFGVLLDCRHLVDRVLQRLFLELQCSNEGFNQLFKFQLRFLLS